MKISTKIILLFLYAGFAQSYPQVKSVTTFADYSIALSKKIEVTEADAVGAGINILFEVTDKFSIGLLAGYKLYSISQADQLRGWEWRFWNERYENKIESDLRADPNLDVTISSVQKMDLIPAAVILSYEIPVVPEFALYPSIGGGVYFYTRRMYVLEEWSKYFPEENYTFEYSYRNFAPDKKGNPFFLLGALNFRYRIFQSAELDGGIQYSRVIPTEGSLGYDSFIFDDELNFRIGLTFIY